MKARSPSAVAALAAFGLASLAYADAPTDPAEGSWLLNASKSKLATPAPKSEVRSYTPVPGGMKIAVKTVELNGESQSEAYDFKHDGKDYAATGNPNYDTVAVTRVDARTTDTVMKRGGKPVGSFHRVVSADGKTLTITYKLTDAAGKQTDETIVYDKQP